ncbi:hypothetical protein LG3211_2139 [Lysobacter gummosus]|nr:hypothetical protein LG3211_2139 [Lysobacter gummosus]
MRRQSIAGKRMAAAARGRTAHRDSRTQWSSMKTLEQADPRIGPIRSQLKIAW